MNDTKISVASQDKSLFLILPKSSGLALFVEDSAFYPSSLSWDLCLYRCSHKHRWLNNDRTHRSSSMFGPRSDTHPSIHSLLARTNHSTTHSKGSAVLHVPQRTDEHVYLPSKHVLYFAPCLQYLSVFDDLQNAIHCPQSSASCSCIPPFTQWCGSCRWNLPDMFFPLLHLVSLQWSSG